MQSLSDYKVEFDDYHPEDWLYDYDSSPTIVPRWPLSPQMTLVVVAVENLNEANESDSEAFVVTSKTNLNEIVAYCREEGNLVALYFTVPKEVLYPHCGGLSAEAWD